MRPRLLTFACLGGIVGILGNSACQPFKDSAQPAAESVATMGKVFMSHSAAFEKLFEMSNAPEASKVKVLAFIKLQRARFVELTAETMKYLEGMGQITYGSGVLASWRAITQQENNKGGVDWEEVLK